MAAATRQPVVVPVSTATRRGEACIKEINNKRSGAQVGQTAFLHAACKQDFHRIFTYPLPSFSRNSTPVLERNSGQ